MTDSSCGFSVWVRFPLGIGCVFALFVLRRFNVPDFLASVFLTRECDDEFDRLNWPTSLI
jgi:hypothetical protein